MSKLALNGGAPVRSKPFPSYNTIGLEEKRAVAQVLDSGVLSQFLGTWSEDFFGGPRVRELEKSWASYFQIKHAVSMNSATSGLYAALGAAGIGPGDEVIVPPFSMIASVSGVLLYQAIPVFADIGADTFCIDPASIRSKITPRTKAIVAVDLFGHPAEWNEIMQIAQENKLIVIEDCAQAPGARYRNQLAGTLAHMGVYSLNYHKHIHCGEGGIVVTQDDSLAERLQLIRNHGEAVVAAKGTKDLVNMIGFNFRMTEIEASIANEQLKKLDRLALPRIELGANLTELMKEFSAITPPVVKPYSTHVYYMYCMKYDAAKAGIPRQKLIAALNAEGIPIGAGYCKPIYMEPLYQKKIAVGKQGFPFTNPAYEGKVSYEKGICPVVERMHERELIHTRFLHAKTTQSDLKDFAKAFEKVFENASELR